MIDPDEPEDREFVVWATVKLVGASMIVSAKNIQEAREIAERSPDFEMVGAEMSDWEITGISES